LRSGFNPLARAYTDKRKGTFVTIVLLIIVAAIGAWVLYHGARKRAERALAEAMLAKSRAARRNRVPEVSNNVKGVTASQTIQPLKSDRTDRAA
jgi:hypothetical protein